MSNAAPSTPPLRLHGVPVSNFYNKVRLILLEKGIAFEEVRAAPGRTPEFLAMNPLGKIPVLEVNGQFLFESEVIAEYLEETFPEPPLLPVDRMERALVRELVHLVDLYLEPQARRLYGVVLRDESVAPEVLADATKRVRVAAAALGRLARLSPYLAGPAFSLADAAAVASLPGLRATFQRAADFDPLAEIPGIDEYFARLLERPAVQKVERGRKAALRMQAMARAAG